MLGRGNSGSAPVASEAAAVVSASASCAGTGNGRAPRRSPPGRAARDWKRGDSPCYTASARRPCNEMVVAVAVAGQHSRVHVALRVRAQGAARAATERALDVCKSFCICGFTFPVAMHDLPTTAANECCWYKYLHTASCRRYSLAAGRGRGRTALPPLAPAKPPHHPHRPPRPWVQLTRPYSLSPLCTVRPCSNVAEYDAPPPIPLFH